MFTSFTRQINREYDNITSEISRAVTQGALVMWDTAVKNTPQDTNTARNGWKLSTIRRRSYIPIRHTQAPPKRPNFRFSVMKHRRIYFYNNVPYISYLEYGAGPGSRVPHFMMKKAKFRFERYVNFHLRKIR